MNPTRRHSLTLALLAAAAAALPTLAAGAEMIDGEVRKVDKDTKKITLKHAEIPNLEMPGMTMVFVVKDKALLDKTTVGSKIRFMAINENSQMTVTDIEPAK